MDKILLFLIIFLPFSILAQGAPKIQIPLNQVNIQEIIRSLPISEEQKKDLIERFIRQFPVPAPSATASPVQPVPSPVSGESKTENLVGPMVPGKGKVELNEGTLEIKIKVPSAGLKLGVRKEEVKELQKILKDLGYLPKEFEINNYFGPSVRDAILKLQREKGLPATGYFGPMTKELLEKLVEEKLKEVEKTEPAEVDVECLKKAVQTKEEELSKERQAYLEKIEKARESRKEKFLSALDIKEPKARKEALVQAQKEYLQEVTRASLQWHEAKSRILNLFKEASKICKAPVESEILIEDKDF